MITPSELKAKLEKKYVDFLQTMLLGIPLSELVIRSNKNYDSKSLAEFEKEIQLITSQSKEKVGYGYTIKFQKVKTKYLGTQDLPITIYFDSESDLLKYLGKEEEVKLLKRNVEKMLALFPELYNWIMRNPARIIQNETKWESILKVLQFFKQNPKPNLYMRELPINVHTKFIEENKSIIKDLLDYLIPDFVKADEKVFEKRFHLKFSEPQIRFKILDREIYDSYFSGVDDMAISASLFNGLKLPVQKVLIVENKTTLYTTLTLPNMSKTIAIFGSGYSVHNLKQTEWLHDVEVLYWGDLDAQGFEILSRFRGYFPKTKSVLMDKQTFDTFFENDLGTISNISTRLNLTDAEKELYDLLKMNNWRLEQEKIPFAFVNQFFGA